MPAAPHNYSLEITPPLAGSPTDVTSYCEWDQWSVQQEYGRQGSTATFVLTAPTGVGGPKETALTLVVKPMGTIEFKDTDTGAVIFAGIMNDPYFVYLSPGLIQYWVQCVDYTYYADSALVNASYGAATGDQVIRNLIGDANNGQGCGITAGVITAAPNIANFQSQYLQLTDAWDQVGNLVSWQNDYNWYVDENLELNWETEQTVPDSGVTFTDTVAGDPTTTLGYIDLTQQFRYEWDGTSLRNRCVVQGASKTATKVDTWQGDGVTTQYVLTFDLDTTGTVTLTIGGVAQTISIVTDTSTATTQYCLVQSGVTGVWSLVPGTAGAPASMATISLTYTYNVPIVQQYDNVLSQTQYDGPNNGVFAVFISDSTLTTASMALQRAISEVAQYAFVLETFTFTTVPNWPGHIRVGERCTINCSYIPDSYNDWQVGVDDQFVVIRNNIQGVAGSYRTYQITAVRVHQLA